MGGQQHAPPTLLPGMTPQLYMRLQILPLFSQYILSLLMFVVKNRELFKLNSNIHHIGTRHNNDLHLPSTHLNLFQKGVYYSGRVFKLKLVRTICSLLCNILILMLI